MICFIFNLLLNLEWSIPAWVLLACHYIFDISIVWFFVALGFWMLVIISGMSIMSWAARCGSIPDPPKENKNPYSVKRMDDKKQ